MSGCYKRVNFYDLCRLCAQNINRTKVKIFEQEGIKIQLQTKIKKCLSISVKEDDFLPKVVCSKCIKMLDLCNTFREECLSSETMLSSYFKNYRHTEDFKQSGKVYIKESQPYITPEPPKLQSKPTSGNLSSPPENLTSMGILVPMTPDVQKSPKKPDIKVPNPTKKHKTCEINLGNCEPQAQTQNVQIPYNLDIIHEALRKAVQQLPKDILNKVIVNSEGEVINLSPPENLIESAQTLLNNSTSVIKHKMIRKNEVVRQGNVENNNGQGVIKIDLTEDENEQQSVEKFNGVRQVAAGNVNQNVPNSSVIIPVPQYQNNNFTTIQSNNVYPQPTRVINVICGTPADQSTVSSSTLNPTISSIKIEDLDTANYPPTGAVSVVKTAPSSNGKKEDKVHTCDVCSKTFKRREHLYQHVKLHTGFRPYQCTECKKTFVRKEHLLRHKVLHSGERNYSCDICNKSFSRNDNLLKHIRTHNREASYTCESCDKVFIMKHFYKSHRSEHGMCYLPPELRNGDL